MTTAADVTVRLATQRDIASITDLESRYYIDNLDVHARAKGFISVVHSPHWFAAAVDSSGLHVAVTADDQIAGFIAVTDPPNRTAPDLPPIVRAMLDLADSVEVNGKPIAAQHWALRGPVCIDEAFRGCGIYAAFNTTTGKFYRDRYDLGVVFVSADNPRSLHTTTTKLGADHWRNSRSIPSATTSWLSTSPAAFDLDTRSSRVPRGRRVSTAELDSDGGAYLGCR